MNVCRSDTHYRGSPLPALITASLLILSLVAVNWAPAAAQPADPQPGVGLLSTGPAGDSLPTDQIILTYSAAVSRQGGFNPEGEAQLERLGVAAGLELAYLRALSAEVHVLRLPGRLAPAALQSVLERLASLPEVAAVEADLILQPVSTPNDPYYSLQWHYFPSTSDTYGINLPQAWDVITDWTPVVVAVLDTGITAHAEFVGITVPGYDFISDAWTANDGDGRDADPSDPGDWVAQGACGTGTPARDSSWHGTHTSGTIGAASNNGKGVAGINWSAKILPVRVLGRCGGYTSDIAEGMRWSAGLSVSGVPGNSNPARVLNLSLGGEGACGTTLQNAVNAVITAGATVVVSAGNSNTDASSFSPANCSGVITVAASNREGGRASYSNYGATVDITAPGGDGTDYNNWVLSTYNTGTTTPGDSAYAWMTGTSMSAPHISGVASLLYLVSPSITPAQVLQVLQDTATPFPAGSSCSTAICGSGIVNAGEAVAKPTATVLVSFDAVTGWDGVTLSWETANELFNSGFNLYRAESVAGERVKLNQALIPSKQPGSQNGASYTYLDDSVQTGRRYFYWLEVMDLSERAWLVSGPIEASTMVQMFLPLIQMGGR